MTEKKDAISYAYSTRQMAALRIRTADARALEASTSGYQTREHKAS